tara:strand:- start:439 stop:678 length:240 start_codon:yes stop_codon:yes gene_type:complete
MRPAPRNPNVFLKEVLIEDKILYSFKQKKHPNLEQRGDCIIDKIIYPITMQASQRIINNTGSCQYINKGIKYGWSNGNK